MVKPPGSCPTPFILQMDHPRFTSLAQHHRSFHSFFCKPLAKYHAINNSIISFMSKGEAPTIRSSLVGILSRGSRKEIHCLIIARPT